MQDQQEPNATPEEEVQADDRFYEQVGDPALSEEDLADISADASQYEDSKAEEAPEAGFGETLNPDEFAADHDKAVQDQDVPDYLRDER